MKRILNEKVIAIYNVDKKELVGIFSSAKLVSAFLFIEKGCNGITKVSSILKNKAVPRKTSLPFKVTLRYANKEQIETIGSSDYLIMDGYEDTLKGKNFGFESTRISLAEFAPKNINNKFYQCRK